jgi:hypothetical protein
MNPSMGNGWSGRPLAPGPLRIEPRVEVGFPDTPLTANAHGRQFARFDQPVHGSEVDLEVLEDFLGGEERFFHSDRNAIMLTGVAISKPAMCTSPVRKCERLTYRRDRVPAGT